MQKLKNLIAILVFFFATASAQTNSGPANFASINSTYYVGAAKGWYSNMQTTVTAACLASGLKRVVIPAGYTGSDSITAITGGCTNAPIVDDRVLPSACYAWSGSAYVTLTCSGGGGGGGSTTLTGDAQGVGTGTVATTVKGINGVQLSTLPTGLLKNTTTTGAPQIAAAGTDYVVPSGNVATATKWATPRTINGVAVDGTANVSITAPPSGGAGGSLGGTYPNPTIAGVGAANAVPVSNGSGALQASGVTADTAGSISGAGLATHNGGVFVNAGGINPATFLGTNLGFVSYHNVGDTAGDLSQNAGCDSTVMTGEVKYMGVGGTGADDFLVSQILANPGCSIATVHDYFSLPGTRSFMSSGTNLFTIGQEAQNGAMAFVRSRNAGDQPFMILSSDLGGATGGTGIYMGGSGGTPPTGGLMKFGNLRAMTSFPVAPGNNFPSDFNTSVREIVAAATTDVDALVVTETNCSTAGTVWSPQAHGCVANGGGGGGSITLTGDAQGAGTGSVATTVKGINGTALSTLGTGLLKNTTSTGVPSIAAAGTDYVVPSGNVATATKWATPRTINGVSVDGTANVVVPAAASTLTGTINPNTLDLGYTTSNYLPPTLGTYAIRKSAAISSGTQTWKSTCLISNTVVYDPTDFPAAPYVMLYGGANTDQCKTTTGSTTGNMQAGIATSPDGITWTDAAANPIFPVNPTAGQPDSGGISSPKLIRYNSLWYLFYTCTTVGGFENGQQNTCLATTPSLAGTPTWTRKGVQLAAASVPWAGMTAGSQLYRPNIFQYNGVWYDFFNAGTAAGSEDVGYATAATPDGPWTFNATRSLCRSSQSGCTTFPAPGALADPEVVQYGHNFYMSGWTFDSSGNLKVWQATTTDETFPNGWKPLGFATSTPSVLRASYIDMNGQMVMYTESGTTGANYSVLAIDEYCFTSQTLGTCAGATAGTGTVNTGTQYAIPYYPAAGTTVGPSGITTDSTGKQLIISNTATGAAVFTDTSFCPNITSGQACARGGGKANSSGNSWFQLWQNGDNTGPNTTPYLSVQTYAGGNPIQFAGSTQVMTSPLMVNNGQSQSAGNKLGAACAGGIAFCVNATSTYTVDTSGNAISAGDIQAATMHSGGTDTTHVVCTPALGNCLSSGSGITALTGDVSASGAGSQNATVTGVNGTQLSTLGTGLYKNTTATGVPSIAVAADIASTLQGVTGCTSAGYTYSPQNNTCLPGGLTNPMTTPGDTIYGGPSGAPARLAGPTTNGIYFQSLTTAGTIAGNPTWLNLYGTGGQWTASQRFSGGMTMDGGQKISVQGAGGTYIQPNGGATVIICSGAASANCLTVGNLTTASVSPLSSPQTIATGSTPTQVAGAAAGTSPTCSAAPTGFNMSGILTCTTGTSPTTGTLVTVTFGGTVSTAPKGCFLQANNAFSAAASTSAYVPAPTTTGWTVMMGSAPTASTVYSWSYLCQ